jgi:hypothetical protein
MTDNAYHNARTDEANRVRALKRHEADVRRLERERFARRLSALCPGTAIEDPDFPGCFHDQAPYPDPIREGLL